MEAVVHACCQPERHVRAVCVLPDQLRIRSQKACERVGKAFRLQQATLLEPAGCADYGIAGAHERRCARIKLPGAFPQLARKAIVEAREVRFPGVAQIQSAELPPQKQAGGANAGLLQLAEPAHEQRQPAPGNPVGQQEVEILVLDDPGNNRPQLHGTVIRLQYGGDRGAS